MDLVFLQEANQNSLEILRTAAGLDWGITAFDGGAPRPTGRSGRGRVAALAGKGEPPRAVGVLPDLDLPERFVYASVATTEGPITVASYHAPPGVSWGIVKVHHAHALLEWINTTPGPVIVGADANTPEIDHPDPDQVRTHWHTGKRRLAGEIGDDVTFGGRPRHRLRDAYRSVVSEHPDLRQRIEQEHPNGPLAISHRTGKRTDHPGTPRRFDTLWVSPDLHVLAAGYDYDGAIAAGTDHALATADITATLPDR